MSEVILRYWKNGIKISDRETYAHFSLETSRYYFSAHPDIKAGEIKQAENKHVYPLKYMDKEPDLKALGKSDAELKLNLDDAKIHVVLSTLSSVSLSWIPYGIDQEGVNSLILVLLALKRSGYYETIDRSAFQYTMKKQSVADFFYRYVVKQDRMSEYKPILKILNRDAQPDDLLIVADMNLNRPSWYRHNAVPIAITATVLMGAGIYFFKKPQKILPCLLSVTPKAVANFLSNKAGIPEEKLKTVFTDAFIRAMK